MEMQPEPAPIHAVEAVDGQQEAQKHMDQTMDVDDSANTTITASTVMPLPDYTQSHIPVQTNNTYAQNNNGYAPSPNSGYAQSPNISYAHSPNTGYAQSPLEQSRQSSQEQYRAPPQEPSRQSSQEQYRQSPQEPYRPSTSYSDTAYQYTAHNGGSRFNTPSDADTPPRQQTYYDSSKETHMGQSQSRPSSQMGRYPTSEGGSRTNSYQEQNQRGSQPAPAEASNKNASVVIKVGMVGDAQIGKTSLMVKYVEGSWDEDYIQTLGE